MRTHEAIHGVEHAQHWPVRQTAEGGVTNEHLESATAEATSAYCVQETVPNTPESLSCDHGAVLCAVQQCPKCFDPMRADVLLVCRQVVRFKIVDNVGQSLLNRLVLKSQNPDVVDID
eukprot:4254837-Heterocapsa_arctica.AAC.1